VTRRWRARQDRHLHAITSPAEPGSGEAVAEAFLARLAARTGSTARLKAVPPLDYDGADGDQIQPLDLDYSGDSP